MRLFSSSWKWTYLSEVDKAIITLLKIRSLPQAWKIRIYFEPRKVWEFMMEIKIEEYMIHCTRVITDLALIIYLLIMSKSLFVGSGPKMKFVQMDVLVTSHQGSFETENTSHWYKSLSSNFVHFTLKILDYLNPQMVSHTWLQ